MKDDTINKEIIKITENAMIHKNISSLIHSNCSDNLKYVNNVNIKLTPSLQTNLSNEYIIYCVNFQ